MDAIPNAPVTGGAALDAGAQPADTKLAEPNGPPAVVAGAGAVEGAKGLGAGAEEVVPNNEVDAVEDPNNPAV